MKRSGVLTILGAGASSDAGYPVASELFRPFLKALQDVSNSELEGREKGMDYLTKIGRTDNFARRGLTTFEWFQTVWKRFEETARKVEPLGVPKLRPDGRPDMSSQVIYDTPEGYPAFAPYAAILGDQPPPPDWSPYLETFFAFYDDYLRPIIFSVREDPSALRSIQSRFRELRKIAIETAYRELGSYGRPPTSYLRSLFSLRGPEHYGCAIATLNHDVALEQIACASAVALYDGFQSKTGGISALPAGWNELRNLKSLWEATSKNSHEFIGFRDAPIDANLLLKLHGSLGWYVLEEGTGDIGYRDELRHNIAYKHFRLPYESLWRQEMQDIAKELASGGPNDPVTRIERGSLSRKAGAMWVRPYLVFARAMKAHPDQLYLDLVGTFGRLLDTAATVLVVGYSWGDPHVNDLILDAVARGASLINISKSALQKSALALWRQRFPTTFNIVRKRLFMFGGGAKMILEHGDVELASGQSVHLDFVESVLRSLPNGLSLEAVSS